MESKTSSLDIATAICEKHGFTIDDIKNLRRCTEIKDIERKEKTVSEQLSILKKEMRNIRKTKTYYEIIRTLRNKEDSFPKIGALLMKDHSTIMNIYYKLVDTEIV